MHIKLRLIEQWAVAICERELGESAVWHDDQSRSGMYDFHFGPSASPTIAVECVSAVDPDFMELWQAGPNRGPSPLDVAGDWIVTVAPRTHIKTLLGGIEGVLRACEAGGTTNVHVDWQLRRADPDLYSVLTSLGVTWLNCVRSTGSGNLFINPDSQGGMVDERGASVAEWLGAYLRDEDRADVLAKLSAVKVAQRHVFIPVGWGGAPWHVESYLTSDLVHLPSTAPDLPTPVTHAWLVSTHAPQGIRWDGDRWVSFNAVFYETP